MNKSNESQKSESNKMIEKKNSVIKSDLIKKTISVTVNTRRGNQVMKIGAYYLKCWSQALAK